MALEAIDKYIDYAIEIEPLPGEAASGDFGLVRIIDKKMLIAAIDVAGHGKNAATIANKMQLFLEKKQMGNLTQLVEDFHYEFKGSRGCVGSFGLLDFETMVFNYIGVGNICAQIIGENKKKFINQPGIIGYVLPHLKEKNIKIKKSDILLFYSDGIKEFFQLRELTEMACLKSSTLTNTILTNFKKDTDDAMCIVVKFLECKILEL